LAKSNYFAGILGVLVGVVILVVSPPAGIFIIIVSVLAAGLAGVRAFDKRKSIQAKLGVTEEKIATTRSKLAELRAQLSFA
jgi:hypothetical protein